MNWSALLELYRSHADVADYAEFGSVSEGGLVFPLVRFTLPGDALCIITSGFHGEEPAGPTTLARHLPELVRYARERDVGLLVYPCVNPSGFDRHTRYNASGERPNNDFLRYELPSGEWVGELAAGQPFLRWKLYDSGPKETQALRAELERQPTPDATIDLHQDDFIASPLAYAYTFGDRTRYRPLVAETERHVAIGRARDLDGHNHTDEDGLVESHDGSVTDYYRRRGTPWCVTLETTTPTPPEAAAAVNLVWVKGIIDLAAERTPRVE